MTKKDFQLIADLISQFEPPFSPRNETDGDDTTQTIETRIALSEAFADVLQEENPRFKKDVFMRACLATE